MPDMFDRAQEVSERLLEVDLQNAGVGTFVLDPGEPGDCDDCGFPSLRLVGGMCARCRDLPRRVH